jgi:hypothetical protein
MAGLRREFLTLAAGGMTVATTVMIPGARAQGAAPPGADAGTGAVLDVRAFGAAGDGRTIDTPAVNRAIGAARSRRSEGLHKARRLVEDFVAKLKPYRAIAPG